MVQAFSAKHASIAPALSRVLGMFSASIYEFISRGVDSCSCVWAVPLRSIWVRANKKEPYLPGTIINEVRACVSRSDEVNTSKGHRRQTLIISYVTAPY